MATEYDVVILGGGVGGYTAAIQAAKRHLKVALVEAKWLGGVCLNQGCIPTKAYLKSAAVLRTSQRQAEFGIEAPTPARVNFNQVFDRKEKIVTHLRQGVQYLMQQNKITVFTGHGTLHAPDQLTVTQATTVTTLRFKRLILAVGSVPKTLPNVPVDGTTVVTSEALLQQKTLPKSMVIIGGGAIGLEWASLLHDLGVDVHVLEYAPHLLSGEAPIAGTTLLKYLRQRHLAITTQAQVTAVVKAAHGAVVHYQDQHGVAQTVATQQVLVAVGRQANTAALDLAQQGIQLHDDGSIVVDADYQTTQPHIYAIGDCLNTLQLAHVAMAEGRYVADILAGLKPEPIDYPAVPRCIYTYPELAIVGPTTIDRQQHPKLKTGQFPYTANGKAAIEGETMGQMQVVLDAATDDVLQVLMVGANATDMIGQAGLSLYLHAAGSEVADQVQPHPTLSEMFRQATLAADHMATDI